MRDDFKTGIRDRFQGGKENDCGFDKKPTEGSNDELQFSNNAPRLGGWRTDANGQKAWIQPTPGGCKDESVTAVDMENSFSDIDVENDFGPTVTASTLSEEERQTWMSDLRGEMNNEDAVLALLLPALPKLQRVDLMMPYGANYVERMFE